MLARSALRFGRPFGATATAQIRNKSTQTAAIDLSLDDHSEEIAKPQTTGSLAHRLQITAEVTVSKIFPAGFCWQGASVLADQAGYEATEVPFFLMTGIGDGLGVAVGHTAFYGLKKMLGSEVDMRSTTHAGIWLGSAAFLLGDRLAAHRQSMPDSIGMGFTGTFTCTWLGCAAAFYGGLRIGRTILPSVLDTLEEPTEANARADSHLSVSIGGATACFVGTDVSFVNATTGMEENWLRPIVGIEDGTPDLTGMAIAGGSTALGFSGAQMVQNLTVPSGKNWVD